MLLSPFHGSSCLSVIILDTSDIFALSMFVSLYAASRSCWNILRTPVQSL